MPRLARPCKSDRIQKSGVRVLVLWMACVGACDRSTQQGHYNHSANMVKMGFQQ
jgi:hypothetical protein